MKVAYPDEQSGELAAKEVRDDGTINEAGSHGTAVATIIGADPDNGGPSGIAGPLGDKLEISMLNQYSGNTAPSRRRRIPTIPRRLVYGDGKTYSHGSLVAINKQIESGANDHQLLVGQRERTPGVAAVYKKYFEKMATEHPDVLFVCSARQHRQGARRHQAVSQRTSAAQHDHRRRARQRRHPCRYSSKASDNYEVTLGAPGTAAVVGTGPDGTAERQDGTSFSAPHVTAAAAILRAINPDSRRETSRTSSPARPARV